MTVGSKFYGRTFGQVYRSLLQGMLAPENRVVDKRMHSEILGAQIVVTDPSQNLILSRQRRLNFIYGLVESIWNLTPTDEIVVLERFNKNIKRYVADQTDQSYVRWAYGPWLNSQILEAVEELSRDQDSRRAVIENLTLIGTRHQSDIGTPPCLVSVQFIIRDGGLVEIVNMRSNDVWYGFPTDVAQFSFWGQLVAGALGVPFTYYVHNVGSMHLYQTEVTPALSAVRLETEMYAASTPLPLDPGQALYEITTGEAYMAIKNDAPERVALTGMRPIVMAILGYREYAPAILNELAAKSWGIGWPVVKSYSAHRSQ